MQNHALYKYGGIVATPGGPQTTFYDQKLRKIKQFHMQQTEVKGSAGDYSRFDPRSMKI